MSLAGAVRIDGLLLAGGRSRRFGADKRRALFGSRTLAEIAVAKLRACVDGDVMIAGAGALARPAATTLIADLVRGRGPLGGIAGGLARSRFGVLVLPCDVPLVALDTVASVARLGRRSGRVVALRSMQGWEPLVAFYPRAAFPAILGALREGLLAPHRLFDRLGALAIAPGSPLETCNVNRPADLELALRAQRTLQSVRTQRRLQAVR